MEKSIGLLIETTGIQDYIFSSNKLKLNLGSSYIIEHLLMDKLLCQVINDVCNEKRGKIEKWFTVSPKLNGEKIRVGYNGGGKCLLFCENKELAEKFLDKFSLQTLLNFPGIGIAAATESYDVNSDNFKEFMNKLNAEISKQRSLHHIISTPQSPGYVRKDAYSLGYVDPINSTEAILDNKQVSVSTLSKLLNVSAAVAQHENDFLKGLPNYSFPLDFEDVCMEEDQGFIAVVHIDGNGMGRKFMEKQDLFSYQELSKKTKDVGKETVRRTVKDLIDLIEKELRGTGLVIENIKSFVEKNKAENNIKLPFRPIISGGDDITFVTDGRLGIYLAEKCIQNFIKVTRETLGEEFHACAGIAIVKRKYPFIRAYHLAEELIKSAKKASRSEGKYSYLDMFISNAGISGSLETIRKQTHERIENGTTCKMHYGPYLVATDQQSSGDRHALTDFIRKMEKTLGATSLSKVQQLREVLYGSKKDRETYLQRLKDIDKGFYQQLTTNLKGEEVLFENNSEYMTTPWTDAIDYRDFYPLNLEFVKQN